MGDEAVRLANELPSFEIGRELMILDCLQGTEKTAHYRYLIKRLERKIAQYKKRINVHEYEKGCIPTEISEGDAALYHVISYMIVRHTVVRCTVISVVDY